MALTVSAYCLTELALATDSTQAPAAWRWELRKIVVERLRGETLERASAMGIASWHVSISHSRKTAAAVAIALG